MLGYKVVLSTGKPGVFKSAIMGPTHGRHYRIGKTTTRKKGDGPLAVFRSRLRAVAFIKKHVDSPSRAYVFRCAYAPSLDDKAYYFWYRTREGMIKYKKTYIPEGTVFADTIILIEEIFEGDEYADTEVR